MGGTVSRLGLLLLPAVAIQSHVKEKRANKNWVEPEVGHYESHGPTGVGSLPSVKLDIWFDEELQSREFNLTLGEYSGGGHLRPVGRRGLVALTGVDGSQEDGYRLDQCSKLTKLTQIFFEAIEVYKIPRAERSRLIIFCPVPGQGWTLYLGLVRDSALTFKALYSPVVLTSPSPVSATIAQAHKKRDLREWALPPSGVYRSDGTMRVGDLTHLKLIIDSNRVVIALGDFTAWGLLERQAQIQRVPLSMGDGMKDTHPSGECFKFKYSAEGSVSAVNAAYRHYRIPAADASSGHKSTNLCPVADVMRGSPVWMIFFCVQRDGRSNVRRLSCPMPLQYVSSLPMPGYAEPERASEVLREAAEVARDDSVPEKSVGRVHRVNRKALAPPRVGYFTGKGDTVGVDLDITPSGGQLTLRPHSRGVRVELDRVPLVAALWGCWRFDMHKSLHKNVDTLKAVEDLVGITSNNMDDFLLCYFAGRWQLQLGSPSPLVVPLDRQAMKRHASVGEVTWPIKKRS